MIGPRNVHPDELGDADGMELQDALRVGNRLADAMEDVPMPVGEAFADRVMAALANEPTPGPTGFLVPLRRKGVIGGFRDSIRQAWASIGSGRPILGRSAALAYVLAAVIAGVSLTGVATFGADSGVCYAALAPSPELTRLHSTLLGALGETCRPHYEVGRWTPHSTLAVNLSDAQMHRARDLLGRGWQPLTGMFEAAELVEFLPVNDIKRWTLCATPRSTRTS